jgi:hypothetical protein
MSAIVPRTCVIVGLWTAACSDRTTVRHAPLSPLAPPGVGAETTGTDGTADTSTTDTSPGTTGATTTSSTPPTTSSTGTTTSSSPTGGTTTSSSVVEACFPGPSSAYDVCLETFELSPVPAAYVYPPPLGGDPQYNAPERFVDLSIEGPSTALAANFVLDEVAQEFKGQYAVVQVHAIERLQAMRDQLGAIVVNSGYRSPDYNASIGGATWSRHMYGDAFDLDPVSATLDGLVQACAAEGAGYIELYATHVHCDWRADGLDPAFYPSPRIVGAPVAPLDHRAAALERGEDGVWSAPAEGFDEGEPLRQWTAYDAAGTIIDTAVGETYAPPADAVEVEVIVGGQVVVVSEAL